MNFSSQNKLAATSRAFTLTELLVVLGMTALLATVLLSAAFTTQERALRAECVNNLRQIGVGLNIYSTEANGYVPICGWPSGQNPWQTYEAARVAPGTSTVTRGFESLGLLFRTKVVTDARLFYCPATSAMSTSRSYDYYATTTNGWPSTSVESGDDNIRTGYHYYPQLRVTETISGTFPPTVVPKLTYSSMLLEYGGALSLVTPAKITALNPKKSITTDLVMTTTTLSHRASGSPIGLNSLFPDGHVSFQTVRNHNKNSPLQPFAPILWATDPGNDPNTFRAIMNGWLP